MTTTNASNALVMRDGATLPDTSNPIAAAAEAPTSFDTPGNFTFTVPSDGLYDITADGAQGGGDSNSDIVGKFSGAWAPRLAATSI